MKTKSFYTVSQITRYIKNVLETDPVVSSLVVEGEISNWKLHYSGHAYFTLKDEHAVISAVMFKSRVSSLSFLPANGMKVLVRGYISVYEPNGRYQLYAENMRQQGIGDLYIAYEKCKAKLKSEGLFDQSLKKKIPMLPKTVGVITSKTGSVLRDIIHVLSRRYENFHLLLYPVAVQGKEAEYKIVNAIQSLNKNRACDVIILARGGGSLEDLYAFNQESTARAIFASSIPIISAVGHETDYTIADFVADARAPTPSAAAEIVLPEKKECLRSIESMKRRLITAARHTVKIRQKSLARVSKRQLAAPLKTRIDRSFIKLDTLTAKCVDLTKKHVRELEHRLETLHAKLHTMLPHETMKRGFSIAMDSKKGHVVKSAYDMKKGQSLDVWFVDGRLTTMVTGTKHVSFDEWLKKVNINESTEK